MNQKDKAFWRLHMKEAAAVNLDTDEKSVELVMDLMVAVGQMDLDTALRKLGQRENRRNGKDLVQVLKVDEDQEDDAEQVDEGKIEYHDYRGELVENHPNEAVHTTPYSMLSVPVGHLG